MCVVLALVIATTALLAGCAAPEPEAVTPAGAPPTTHDAATALTPPDNPVATEPAAPQPVPHAARLDGRLETGARVCQPSTNACDEVRPTADDQELFIPDLAGTLVAGNATLTWEPASDLMREMRLTVWFVPACDDCDLVFLGGTTAPGPIHAVFDTPLDLDGGSIWAYARAPYANRVDDVYVQNDFEQDFTIEVHALVQPLTSA